MLDGDAGDGGRLVGGALEPRVIRTSGRRRLRTIWTNGRRIEVRVSTSARTGQERSERTPQHTVYRTPYEDERFKPRKDERINNKEEGRTLTVWTSGHSGKGRTLEQFWTNGLNSFDERPQQQCEGRTLTVWTSGLSGKGRTVTVWTSDLSNSGEGRTLEQFWTNGLNSFKMERTRSMQDERSCHVEDERFPEDERH
ncbi:hypothetical protein LR48_Vigan09g092100 [Vigna angularis]|uniref:Uncharacterized protein n=1 Tax=Phaseolus angularis TaxID=3914 RepID=A0A0L9VBF7_PHAAN|nr:hypothetical protein LR48_Vigan09g092100 [Vigna angularis]